MSVQPSLFDEGARRRDVGHQSALSHWATEAIAESIKAVARRGRDFTSEDVLDDLSPAIRDSLRLHPNSLGACMRSAGVQGLITPTGEYRPANRPEARKRKLQVWRAP